jgi:hypothetical protein
LNWSCGKVPALVQVRLRAVRIVDARLVTAAAAEGVAAAAEGVAAAGEVTARAEDAVSVIV